MSRATLRRPPAVRKTRNLTLVGKRRLSPHFMRLTFAGEELRDFEYMGYDQWFRFFMPTSPESIASIPDKFGVIDWAKLRLVPEKDRPVVRNYTIRAFRPGSATNEPELDVDIVIHTPGDEAAGLGEAWVKRCEVGDGAAFFDEGCLFCPFAGAKRLVIACDETGLPAAAGILASMPRSTVGIALLEVPSLDDGQEIDAPAGVQIRWLPRDDAELLPGTLALAAFLKEPELAHSQVFAVGEMAFTNGIQGHMKALGARAKGQVMAQCYWRHGHLKG